MPADEEIDRKTADRLVQSETWRRYLEKNLLPLYDRVSQSLDGAESDHRFLQGMKQALRVAIERPYLVAERKSPLVADRRVVDKEFPRDETREPEQEPEVTPIRPVPQSDRSSFPV